MKHSVVVTGGAGFIGSSLVRSLLANGHVVAVIDDFSTGNGANLAGVSDRLTLHKANICDYDTILPFFESVDWVIHLAAIPSVPRSILEPVLCHEVNINGTFNVLRAAAGAKVKRLVYAASSSAYGDTEILPKTESMAPRPKSPYAVQKLLGEYYATVFDTCFGLDTVSLRFFNVFGPRQDPTSVYSGVLSLFMKCLIERRSPTIYGDGEQSRDFIFVEDLAGLIIRACETPCIAGRTYNAGNGTRYTVNETWNLLQKIERVNLPPTYGPSRAGDVRHSQADTTAAVSELGYTPRHTFEEGLRKTLAWYKANHLANADETTALH
jgi:nucleoside-diphosphate-sugar epimerase